MFLVSNLRCLKSSFPFPPGLSLCFLWLLHFSMVFLVKTIRKIRIMYTDQHKETDTSTADGTNGRITLIDEFEQGKILVDI